MSVEITTVETVICKHCGSKALVKYGSYKGVPRYFCKSCNRKFKKDDRQFKMRLPTEQMASTLHDYYDGGSSVRAIGRPRKVRISDKPPRITPKVEKLR